MIQQEQIQEQIPYSPLLEDLERRLAVLSDGYAANHKNLVDTRAELQQQIEQVDHRLIEVDVKLTRRLDALDTKVGALDTKVDALGAQVGALGAQVSLITTHLGIEERAAPGKPSAHRGSKQRRARTK